LKLSKINLYYLIYTTKKIKKMIDIESASKLISVSKSTLRRWEKEGKLKSYRTPGNHRRYDEKELFKMISNDKRIC